MVVELGMVGLRLGAGGDGESMRFRWRCVED